MKIAIEQLGLGPCHHMVEVMRNPAQPAFWKAIAAGEKPAWTEVFYGYNSQVDFPGAAFWRETIVAFPDAKVVHTERPEDEWWNSFNVTISKFMTRVPDMALPPEIKNIFKSMEGWMEDLFGRPVERDAAIASYRRNNQMVRDLIAPERLLVFNVAEGWGPLCRFLGVPQPGTPFPRSHPRDEFWAHFGGEPA